MTRLTWGALPPMYDLGLNQGVLYLPDAVVPWNGLVSVEEKATGTLNTEHYYDGNRVHISQDVGEFEAQISAYTYPDVFDEYNGYSPIPKEQRFGLSYRTQHGDEGARLHIVYNALVRKDSWGWKTQTDQPNIELFTWDIYGEPMPVPGARPTSHLVLEASRDAGLLLMLEDMLYGTDDADPRLPTPTELADIYESAALLRVSYNADGSYTATGPDDMIEVLDNGRIRFSAPSVLMIDPDERFVIHSY